MSIKAYSVMSWLEKNLYRGEIKVIYVTSYTRFNRFQNV